MRYNINQIINETINRFENCKEDLPYSYVPVEPIKNNIVSVCGEKIEIYVSSLLSDAWIEAYPQYAKIFEDDIDFRNAVDSASGKWLEPKYSNDKYCILLACEKVSSSEDLIFTFAHELRHCYDFIKSIHVCNKTELPSDISKFSLWSEFNAIYTDTVLRLYPYSKSELSFKDLSSYLGYKTADCIAGMYKSEEKNDYFAMRFAGTHRAIRDISEYFAPSPVFQLWRMIPSYIDERYPRIFYSENEMQKMEYFDFSKQ